MIYLSNEMFWKRTGGPNGSLEIDGFRNVRVSITGNGFWDFRKTEETLLDLCFVFF